LTTDISPVDQLRRYISQFGDKPCCFTDTQLYTDLLSIDEQRQVNWLSAVWPRYIIRKWPIYIDMVENWVS